jgi:hypothetical protein
MVTSVRVVSAGFLSASVVYLSVAEVAAVATCRSRSRHCRCSGRHCRCSGCGSRRRGALAATSVVAGAAVRWRTRHGQSRRPPVSCGNPVYGLPVASCQEVRECCFVASPWKGPRTSGGDRRFGGGLALGCGQSQQLVWICLWAAAGLNEACRARSRRFGRALTSVWAMVRA